MGSQANNFEELVPLVDLCRAGKLFEVQAWIAESKPVNPPTGHYRGSRKKTPIEYAIDAGFHSLVKVLLDAGADVGPIDRYCPMTMALEKRRLDIVKLLVEHGYDPICVDARSVLGTWDPEIMEYIVESGCNLELGNPLAWALCNRIRTSLPLVKKYQDRFPSIKEQANIALRHHCKEGDAKWVSLMLWAGADPLCRGEEDPDREPDLEDGGLSALGFAALYNHYGLFELKGIKACLSNPAAAEILDYLLGSDATPVLASILKRGLDPNNNPRGGCTAIQRCLERFHQYGSNSRFSFDYHFAPKNKSKLDSDRSREFMKMIYLLAKAGGKWRPDPDEIKSARNSLTKMIPEYTVEFIGLMARFKAARKEDLEELLRTPTIKALVGKYRNRIDEQLESLANDDSVTR
jgi:ankyrin repeat protein